jgi:arylsulfatase A-like enzyme
MARSWSLLLIPALLLGCGSREDAAWTPEGRRARNVVIIALDTVRADRVALCDRRSPEREVAPNLRALAARGTCFDNAISQASWTMPAFGSIMSGLYPRQHGGISLYGSVPAEMELLPEILREGGYETASVVSHQFVAARRGFDGYAHTDESQVRGHRAITSRRVTRGALRFLDERDPDRPFFLFVHYFDPHYRYNDHDSIHWADDYEGWARVDMDVMEGLRAKRHLLTGRDLAFVLDTYDEEVAFADRYIGAFLEGLADRGLDDDTAIIVVGDHGEEFMEHGWLGHTISLYDELIRVPLALVLPGQVPTDAVVAHPVETRAVFRTVLEYLEVDHDDQRTRPSLLPVAQGAETGPGAVFSSVWLPDAKVRSGKRVEMISVRTDRWKLVLDYTHEREQLYDLQADPGELSPLSPAARVPFAELKEQLEAWDHGIRASATEGGAYEPSEEEIEELRLLGYL